MCARHANWHLYHIMNGIHSIRCAQELLLVQTLVQTLDVSTLGM